MTSKVEALKANMEKEMVKAQAIDGFTAQFPTELPEPRMVVYHNSTLSMLSIHYEFDNIENAYEIIEAFAPYTLPLLMHKAKGEPTRFLTRAHETKQEWGSPRDLAKNYTVA